MDHITPEQRQQIEQKRLEALRRKNNIFENKENVPTNSAQTKAQLINSLTNAIPALQRSLPSQGTLKESGNITPIKRAIDQTDKKGETETKRPKLMTSSFFNANNIPSTLSQSGGLKITPFTDEQEPSSYRTTTSPLFRIKSDLNKFKYTPAAALKVVAKPKIYPKEWKIVDNSQDLEVFFQQVCATDIVIWGAICLNGHTNYRCRSKDNITTQTTWCTLSSIQGIGFLLGDASELHVVDFTAQYKEEDYETSKWEFMTRFLQTTSCTKVCYNLQWMLFPIFTKVSYANIRTNLLFDLKIACWISEPEFNDKNYEYGELVHFFLNKLEGLQAKFDFKSQFVRDLQTSRELYKYLVTHLREKKLDEAFWKEMKLSVILSQMEFEGIGFDEQYLKNSDRTISKHLEELSNLAQESLGHPVNLMSHKQVAIAIYDELKLIPSLPTKTAKVKSDKKQSDRSTSAKVLLSMMGQHIFPSVVKEYRQIQKLHAWVTGLHQYSDRESGSLRIHTHWTQTRTGTGRLSSISPNLQNVPKNGLEMEEYDDEDQNDCESEDEELDYPNSPLHTKHTKPLPPLKIRSAFVAKPGYILVSADYSQIEFRLLAHFSADEQLIDFVTNGEDIHTQIASRWLGKPSNEITKGDRDYSKKIVYGILYGMGQNALAKIIQTSPKQAKRFMDSFLSKFPKVQNFLKTSISEAKQRGEVRTLMGRIRKLPHIISKMPLLAKRAERQAVNSRLQGSAADIIKLAMIGMDDAIKSNYNDVGNSRLLLQIHDELIFEVEETKLNANLKVIKEKMDNAYPELLVPLATTVSVGKAWGDMNPVESATNTNLIGEIPQYDNIEEDCWSIMNDSELQNESENKQTDSFASEFVMDSEDQMNDLLLLSSTPTKSLFEDDDGDLPSTNELMQVFGVNSI